MEEINKLADRDFSNQGLNPSEYEELMRISENFTISPDGVLANRSKSLPLCQKSGDLLKFYLQQRRLLTVIREEGAVTQEVVKRDLKADLKDSVKSNKMKK